MKFSIIIPTMNEAQTITNCLTPLQSLRKAGELIVVDGGSEDNTMALAKPLADKLIPSATGRAIQMNNGAAHANGEVLIFLHADTSLPDAGVELISQAITDKRQWGRFDIKLKGSHLMLTVVAWFMNCRSRLTGVATGDQAIFITKSLFESVGRYPAIPLMEDVALCKILKKMSPPLCLKAKVTSSGRRWEKFGVIKTILLMWNLRLRYYFGTDPRLLAVLYNKGQFWKT
jgi:rSAM/selenodomain-associated transferase 2